MNLNRMSDLYQQQTGRALGFKLKSKETGRLWEATHKTGLGKYVIVDVNGQKEALVDGTADRYDFADATLNTDANRANELNVKLAELTNQERSLEEELASLEARMAIVQNEIADVEVELDTLT